MSEWWEMKERQMVPKPVVDLAGVVCVCVCVCE